MRKICIFILSLFILHQTKAQNLKLGIKGGLSIPNLRAPGNGSFSSGYKSVSGPHFGLLSEYTISDRFSIQAEFNYSTQGGRKEGPQRIRTRDLKPYLPSGFSIPDSIPYIYATFNNQIDLAYLELPVMAKFGFDVSENVRLAIYGGPYVGYLVKGKGSGEGQSKIYIDAAHTKPLTIRVNNINFEVPPLDFTRTEDLIDRLNRWNYGVQGGGSIAYSLSAIELFFAAGGSYGFATLQKDENFGKNKTGSAMLSVGATIRL